MSSAPATERKKYSVIKVIINDGTLYINLIIKVFIEVDYCQPQLYLVNTISLKFLVVNE